MRNTLLSLLTALTIGLLPLNANEHSNTSAVQAPQVQPAKAPSFEFTTIKGKKIKVVGTEDGLDFTTFKEKNVITMFYIYPGKPCRDELKLFTKIKKNHEDLEFVTFELKGLAPEKFEAFQKELGIEGLHMIDAKQALPFANYIAQLAKWPGSVPLLIITDKKGTVKHMQLGAMSEKEVEDMLKKL